MQHLNVVVFFCWELWQFLYKKNTIKRKLLFIIRFKLFLSILRKKCTFYWNLFFLQKKIEILKHVSLPNQSKLEIVQPCKVIIPSVGLKSLLKDNTSIGNRTQSRKTLQSILPANKSTQGSFQKNSTKSYSLNGLLTKGSGEGSSQNVQITSDCRNSPERIFSVCVESLKGSPNIKIIQQAGVKKVSDYTRLYGSGQHWRVITLY